MKETQKLRLMRVGYGDELLAEWDLNLPETVCRARSTFESQFTAGRMAFRLNGPGDQIPLTEWDENAPEILIVPAIQGG